MYKKIIFSVSILFLFIGCQDNSLNSEIIGLWSKSVPITYNAGPNKHLNTVIYEYDFKKNGKGNWKHREIKSVNGKSDYAYTINYDIEWKITKDSIYNLVTINYLKGEISDLSGDDKLVVEQKAIESKDNQMKNSSKLWFYKDGNGKIIWSYYKDGFDDNSFTMNYEKK